MSTFDEVRDSLAKLKEYRRMYYGYDALFSGELPQYYSNATVREDVREAASLYRLNLSKICVTTPLQRTVISGISSPDDTALKFIESVWRDNELMFDSVEAHKKAYLYGNAVIIALPDSSVPSGISAYVHSPASVLVEYREDAPRVKSKATHIYDDYFNGSLYTYVVVYKPDVIEKWRSSSPISETLSSDYTKLDYILEEELNEPIPGVIPVFHFRTSRDALGESRLSGIEGAQWAINDTFVAMMRAIRSAGHRQRYTINETSVEPEDRFEEPEGGYTQSPEIDTSRFIDGADTFLNFSGKKVSVGSFDVSESSNFIAPIDKITGWMARISDIPVSSFFDGDTPASGVAIRRSERPLNALVAMCKSLFGSTWKSFFSYCLRLKGISGECDVVWSASVADDVEFYDVQEAKRSFGVPNSVLLHEGGYSMEEVEQWEVDKEEPIGEPDGTVA